MAIHSSSSSGERQTLRVLSLPVLHVLRVLVAVGLAWLTATTLGLPQAHWAAISALIVVQGTLGTTVRAGRDRMLATAFGAMMGALAGIAHLHGWPELIVWIIALLPTVALAGIRAEYRTAPIAAIIVISSAISNGSPLWVALFRMAEISIGALIGVAVSRWLLPGSSRERMHHHAVELIATLSSFAADIGRDRSDTYSNEARTNAIRSTLREIALIARGARHENDASHAHTIALATSLRRLQEDLAFIARVCAETRRLAPALSPVLEKIGPALCDALNEVRLKLVNVNPSSRSLQVDVLVPIETLHSGTIRVVESGAALRFSLQSVSRQLEAIASS